MCQNYSQNTMTMNDAEVSNDQSKQKSINQSPDSSDADASAKVKVKEDSSESKIIEPVAADTRSNDSPAAAGNDKAPPQAQTTTTTTITAKRDFNRFPEKVGFALPVDQTGMRISGFVVLSLTRAFFISLLLLFSC